MRFFGAPSGSAPPEACGQAALLSKVLGAAPNAQRPT